MFSGHVCFPNISTLLIQLELSGKKKKKMCFPCKFVFAWKFLMGKQNISRTMYDFYCIYNLWFSKNTGKEKKRKKKKKQHCHYSLVMLTFSFKELNISSHKMYCTRADHEIWALVAFFTFQNKPQYKILCEPLFCRFVSGELS